MNRREKFASILGENDEEKWKEKMKKIGKREEKKGEKRKKKRRFLKK